MKALHEQERGPDGRLRCTCQRDSLVLADREAELLAVKGPCSNKQCRLHYAHSGPCDTRASRP